MISTEGSASAVRERAARWHVGHGDCLALLAELPDNSIDSLVTDPPAGIGFMGKDWDDLGKVQRGRVRSEDPHKNTKGVLPGDGRGGTAEDRHKHRVRSRDAFIPWLTEILTEAYRVLKPGAHGLVWALPRTSHWTGMAIDLAGFEIVDQISHLFSQGASKSKSARRMLAMENCELPGRHFESSLPQTEKREEGDHICADHSAPSEWDGHGTGLAPAHEDWWLVRKPLDGTIAENLAKWGTGVIDIDGCRIPTPGGPGRWPKNVAASHALGCQKVGTAFAPANPSWDTPHRATAPALFTGPAVSKVRHTSRQWEASRDRRYTSRGSASMAKLPGERREEVEQVDVWQCEEGCAVLALYRQGGESKSGTMKGGTMRKSRNGVVYGELTASANRLDTIGDEGPITRFYLQLPSTEIVVPYRYQPKPSRAERDGGLTHFRARTGAEATDSEEGQARLDNPRTGAGRGGGAKNIHPTGKSDEWMRYCVRLVCPPGGIVLDLFAGSGTTGGAAVKEGRRFIGYELNNTDEHPYVEIARARITWAEGAGELVPRESLRGDTSGGSMFDRETP